MLHKNLPNSVKDVDAVSGVVCGYASSFNVVDDGNDMVLPGAFDRSIKEWGPGSKQPRIKFLYQHDTTAILGVPQVLKEDGFGLYFEVKIAPTSLGRDVLTLYQADCITEHSIGYETVTAEWDRAKAVRLLRDLKLYECSAVTFGMNPETPTVAVKSLADPSRLSALADQAARLDSILHSGNLRSDALCETLERELKALHAALAPSQAASERPYTIQRVLDSMNDLKSRLEVKGATGKATWPLGERDAAWDGGAAHKRIVEWATKSDDTVDTGKLQSVHFYSPDGDAAENVSEYKLLFCDVVDGKVTAMPKAIFACAGSHGVDATTGISDSDKAAIRKKISAYYARMAKQFDDDTIVAPWDQDDGGKASQHMNTRMVKGSGGDLAVSADGTHAAYTGTHEHSHTTKGSQGGDKMHSHPHPHDGDASHDHPDTHDAPPPPAKAPKAALRRPVRKARDFDTLFASLNASDQLQDDWGDTFIAFVNCMAELMQQSCAQDNGWLPDSMEHVDIAEAAQANVDAFSKAVMDLVTRSVAASFAPQLTCDMDQFVDPDSTTQDHDDYDDYKSRTPLAATPAAPLRMKVGRAISGANRDTLAKALNGIADGVKTINEHHGAIKSLLEKTDPDAVRQDEDDALGDDDTENGGTDPNKSRLTSDPQHRTAAARPARAGTTHQQGASNPSIDLSAIVADLDALKGRLTAHAR